MDDMTSPKAVHLYGIISVPLVFFIFWKNACIKTIQVHTYGELFRIKNFRTGASEYLKDYHTFGITKKASVICFVFHILLL